MGPRRENLEQTVKRFTAKPLLLTAAKLAMTGDQVAALERLAGGLRKVTRPGPKKSMGAKDIADAFRADGQPAVYSSAASSCC